MVVDGGPCEHPANARYFDIDEIKCRLCTRSLNYPAREPTQQDARDRLEDKRAAMGESGREYQPTESEPEPAPEPAPAPEPVLACSCCHRLLPPDSFSTRNHRTSRNRDYRASMCRSCVALRIRIKRIENPEPMRAASRRRAELVREKRKTGQLPALVLTATQRTSNNAASRRYQDRLRGAPVLLRKSGRPPILIKAICRVSLSCPLAPYCVDKVAAAKAVGVGQGP